MAAQTLWIFDTAIEKCYVPSVKKKGPSVHYEKAKKTKYLWAKHSLVLLSRNRSFHSANNVTRSGSVSFWKMLIFFYEDTFKKNYFANEKDARSSSSKMKQEREYFRSGRRINSNLSGVRFSTPSRRDRAKVIKITQSVRAMILCFFF